MKKGTLRRWRLPAMALGAACVLLAAVIIRRNLSGPAWFVEAGLEGQWGELLEKAASPPPFTRLRVYDPAAVSGKGRRGVVITKNFLPEAANSDANLTADSDADDLQDSYGAGMAEESWEPRLRVWPGLCQGRADYLGAVPLALDPWLVFRKTGDPRLSLERVLDGGGGEGALLLPGAEAEAVHAWIAQLLQAGPGVFPADRQAWEDAEARLVYGNRRFQQGALTCSWLDVWLRLLGGETAWLYAPLSGTRGLGPYDAGRLDATIFPIHGDWHTYGLQAEILWALPMERAEPEPRIDEALAWLADPETQRIIADLLGWIPAQNGGAPRDTLARQAQVAWFSSGFVWSVPPQ